MYRPENLSIDGTRFLGRWNGIIPVYDVLTMQGLNAIVGCVKHIFNRINGLTKEEKQKLSQNAVTTAKRFSESDVAKRYLENITGEL